MMSFSFFRRWVRSCVGAIFSPFGLAVISKEHLANEGADTVLQSIPDAVTHLRIEDANKITAKAGMTLLHRAVLDRTYWFGVQANKNPCDFWVYQQIIADKKPDVLIEIGSRFGGSTLGFAHLMDIANKGRVIAIDIESEIMDERATLHPRVTVLDGDANTLVNEVRAMIDEDETVMLIEDSSHTYENTLSVLRNYSDVVTSGQYLVIEDSVARHGLDGGPSHGPYDALETFLSQTQEYILDRDKEQFFFTFNPKGFLLKK